MLKILILSAVMANVAYAQSYIQPEQIHLSVGMNDNEMVVTWLTRNMTKASVVEYGMNSMMNMTASGTATNFTDGGSQHRSMFIHRATMMVQPGRSYLYHVGSPLEAWSSVFYFKAPPTSDPSWQPRIAFYGDLGNVNSRSMAYLQEDVQRGNYDAIWHVGDFAYNMDTNNAQVGDEFMRMIEAVAGYVPYMTCPGNHEEAYNFSNYINRFSMPGGSNNSLFYSFDMGPAHVVAISTEYYFFGSSYGYDPVVSQYNWLVEDLKKANMPANRAARPWIIVFGHRPMYCSNKDSDDCTKANSLVRNGLPSMKLCGLEDLFLDFGVDLQIWAHEHSYERLWPVYNMTIRNGTDMPGHPYHNPNAPVHMTTGSAGCQEDHDGFGPAQPWTAFRNSDYGFSTLTMNKTHLHIQQYSDDKMEVVDDFWFVKTHDYPSYYREKSRRNRHRSSADPCMPMFL